MSETPVIPTVLAEEFVTVNVVGSEVFPTVTLPKVPLPGLDVNAIPAASALAAVTKNETMRIRLSRMTFPPV